MDRSHFELLIMNHIEPKNGDKSLMHLLKQNLTNEMFHSILCGLETPHLIKKIFLLTFVLLANCLASYTTVTLVISYLEYNVITTSRVIYDPPVLFPKIKICNTNMFTTRYAFDFLSRLIKREKFPINFLDESQLKNVSFAKKREIFNKFKFIATELLTSMPDAEKKRMSHRWEDTLLACRFNYKPCQSDDFSWEFEGTLGNCYSFNAGAQERAAKRSTISGKSFGLQMELYVNYYEGLIAFNSFTSASGLLVRIENASHLIDNGLSSIRVSPGLDTFIGLSREFRVSLPRPYSNCESSNFDSDLYRLIQQSSYDYSREFCFKQCTQMLLIRDCNCTFSIFSSLFDSIKCESLERIACAVNYYSNVYLEGNYLQDFCQPKCPLECNSTKFTYSLSFNELNVLSYVDLIQSNFSFDFVKRQVDGQTAKSSIVSLNVYYDSLAYTVLAESPQMDVISLVANIGGNLGLFLGVSLFSLGEILTTLFEIYYVRKEKVGINS